jgi:hypothetical protein
VALFDRWRRQFVEDLTLDQATDYLARERTASLRVLRADGQRVDLTAQDAGTRLALVRQEWQTDAWTYRDMIGELRYAQRLLARSVATVRFFAAELPEDSTEDPIELAGPDYKGDPALAKDAVENLARLPLDDGPDGFLATMTENIETAGECWIHGQQDDEDGETWSIRSVSEIMGAGDQVMLLELPTISSLGQRAINPKTEELLRCWTRHPRWGKLADSPLRAMLDVLEEVVLTGREQRAAARSRIAANGVMLVPNSLELLQSRDTAEDSDAPEGLADTDFMRDFTEALTAPIRNEGDPGAVAPLILRGEAEALKEVRHLTLTRDDAAKLMDRLQGAVLRMLQGLDIQPEQVTGIGATNHWGGWQIEASNIRHQVLPTCGVVAGMLTKAFLRPALKALGYPPEKVRRIVVWYDPTALVESPDRSQDARDAWDRDAISNAALREALGFPEDAVPEPHEHLVRLLSRGRLTPQAVPLVAALSGVKLDDPDLQAALAIAVGLVAPAPHAGPPTVQGQVVRALPAGQPAPPAAPAGSTATPAGPGQVVPEQTAPTPTGPAAPPAVTAAGVPVEGWRVDIDTARQLAQVDAVLMDRILTAADAAIVRAVERAGGRVRNAARKTPALVASIEGVEVTLIASVLGRDTVGSFASVSDLLAGAYTRLRDQFGGWLDQAARSAATIVVKLLGLSTSSPAGREIRDQVITRYSVHRDAAWSALSEALDAATDKALFRADPLTPDPTPGEAADTLLSPAAVARALVIAGGGTPGQPGDFGFGTGPVTRQAMTQQGGVVLGWEWQYNPAQPRRSHFLPHQVLDGARFGTWTDPKLDTTPGSEWIGSYFHPQDHDGCLCSSTPVLAFPTNDPDDIVGQRIRAAQQSHRGRVAAKVAAEDTAAGRIGTSIQNEVETRDRILAGVEALRAHYIEGVSV